MASLAQRDVSGGGKPEPLKHTVSDLWSRRITDEHRVVNYSLEIAQPRLKTPLTA